MSAARLDLLPPIAGAELRLQGLGRRFGGLQALDHIDLHLRPGGLLGLIGPNGAGKSTLINLVTGVDRPDTGRVLIDGHDTTGRSPVALAHAGLARTFQHGRVFGNLSVLDNVLVGAHTRLAHRPGPWGALREAFGALWPGASGQAAEKALRDEAEALIALFGDRLWPRRHEPVHRLSYANRRRVEIARALALRPRLLLLDEPAAGMNPVETAEIFEFIEGLRARGLSLLLVEHKLDELMRVSDTVVVLDHGRKIADGPPAQVRHAPQVVQAYLGDRHLGAGVGADADTGPDTTKAGTQPPTAAPRKAWA